MNCEFSFKQMQSSQTFIDFARPRIIAKIEKFVTKPIEAHTTVSKQGQEYTANFTLKAGDGFNFQVHATCQDLFSVIELVLKKLETKMKKQKDKIKHHKRPINANLKYLKVVEDQTDSWENESMEADDVIKLEELRRKRS